MRDNINKVSQRGENLDSLQDKTDNLAVSAQGFRRGANRVRKQMWWKGLSSLADVADADHVLTIHRHEDEDVHRGRRNSSLDRYYCSVRYATTYPSSCTCSPSETKLTSTQLWRLGRRALSPLQMFSMATLHSNSDSENIAIANEIYSKTTITTSLQQINLG